MSDDPRRDASLRYLYAISPEDHARVPAYAALAIALSESAVAIDLLCAVRPEQQNAMLIFAGLHDVALSGHPVLSPLYEDLRAGRGAAPQEFAQRVIEVLEADPHLLDGHIDRSTQTNEVNRSATLQAILRVLGREGVRDLNLIDVGTSAGLNLYPDLLHVRSEDDGQPLTLVSTSLAGPWPEGPLPHIRARVGLDPHPLEINNETDLRWLRACLWPEDGRRRERADAVVAHVPSWPERTILTGTATDALEEALRLVDSSVPTLVQHTWVAAYFSPDDQRAFYELMMDLTATRPVYWAYLEWPRSVPGLLPPPAHEPPPRPGASQIVVTRPGEPPRSWGWSHSHGHWISFDPALTA